MKNATLGYHTFTISKRLTRQEGLFLLKDFNKYKRKMGEMRIRPTRDKKGSIIPNFHDMEYINKNAGISWKIMHNHYLGDKPYSVHIKINPKILTGTVDYIAAANAGHLNEVESYFNHTVKNISYHLGQFNDYNLHRVDYCVNFDIRELGLNCTPEQMMKLIRRADIPTHFEEWAKYDKTAHRSKVDKNQFRLESDSVIINCYLKYWQFLNEYPDCPDLDASRYVIRFEIQYLYQKVYTMSAILKNNPETINIKQEMLSDPMCSDTIRKYFARVIKNGDYFSLDDARWMVEAHHFKPKKEKRLISALDFVNESRGIAKAKAKLLGDELAAFLQSLRELASIGVNPVTIPREWGINHIPNLLRTYDNKVSDELTDEKFGSCKINCVNS